MDGSGRKAKKKGTEGKETERKNEVKRKMEGKEGKGGRNEKKVTEERESKGKNAIEKKEIKQRAFNCL
jgi:hypothetical protein